MVAAVAAQVEEPPAGRVDGEGEHLHVRREALERRAHDEVGELVVDDPHLDAPVRGVDERLLEALADGVALPDVGLEQDLLLRSLDRGQHVVVQVLAEGVRRDRPVADGRLLRRPGRERLGLLAAATVGVDQAHRDRDHQRDPEDDEQRPLDHHRHRVGVVDERVPGGHAAIQPEGSWVTGDGDGQLRGDRPPSHVRRACRRSRAPAGAARGASSARRAGRGPLPARPSPRRARCPRRPASWSTSTRVVSTAPSLPSTVPSTPSTFFRALSARLRMSPTGLQCHHVMPTTKTPRGSGGESASADARTQVRPTELIHAGGTSRSQTCVRAFTRSGTWSATSQARSPGSCRCSDVRSAACVQSPISSAGWRPSR